MISFDAIVYMVGAVGLVGFVGLIYFILKRGGRNMSPVDPAFRKKISAKRELLIMVSIAVIVGAFVLGVFLMTSAPS